MDNNIKCPPFPIGTRIKVTDSGKDEHGADGCSGIFGYGIDKCKYVIGTIVADVEESKSLSGLLRTDPGFNVKLEDDGRIWRIHPNAIVESLEPKVKVGSYNIKDILGKKIAIHCPTQDEWNKVLPIVCADNLTRIVPRHWKDYTINSCLSCNNESTALTSLCSRSYYEGNNYIIITAEEFLRDNLVKPVFKVGDWVTCTEFDRNQSCGVGWILGRTFKIGKVTEQRSKYCVFPEGKNDEGVFTDFLRHATTEDVKISQEYIKLTAETTTTPVYKIGDWVTYLVDKPSKGMPNNNWTKGKTRKISKVGDSDGIQKEIVWADDEAVGIYMQDIRYATEEEIKKATAGHVEPWSITTQDEDVIIIGDVYRHKDSPTSLGWRIKDIKSGNVVVTLITTGKDSCDYSIQSVLEYIKDGTWIKVQQPTTKYIPVTESNVFRGIKVVRGPDWKYGDQDGGIGSIGTIQTRELGQEGYRYVQWPNGKKYSYRIGHNNYHDLYVATDNEISTSNNNNNNNNQSQIKTTQHVTEQSNSSRSNTGSEQTILSGYSEEPAFERGNRKPGSTGSGGGQSLTIVRGHKRNGKVFKGSEESSCWPS